MPEKVLFKTGRIHGFSNRNAADDAEAVWRSHKKKSAINYGLDRKAAFPTNRRNHGCKTELFPEKFSSSLPLYPNVVFLFLPQNLTAASLCSLSIREVFARSYPIRTVIQFSIYPSIGRQREGLFINPLNNQLGTFSPFARKDFCKFFVNGGYNDKKNRYTAHQISGR